MDEHVEQGLKTRIGVICPDDGVNDDEYWQYLPPDGSVSLHWTRYRTPQRFEPISVSMVGSYGDTSIIADAAQTLRIVRPNVAAFCCNSCSFVHGTKVDQQIRDAIAEVADTIATSITHAQIEALRVLEVKRVAIGAPYQPSVTAKLQQLLEGCGFTVTCSKSLSLPTEWQIGNSRPQRWYDLAREVDSPQAQAVLLACGGIRTAEIIDPLERDIGGKPVISAPAVMVWHSLRLAGVKTRVHGRGILLEKY